MDESIKSSGNSAPNLIFEEIFDERTQFESKARGYFGPVEVQLQEGNTFRLFFYSPTRLKQDLECEISEGRICLAEPGMVVLPEITLENMERAINELNNAGFFNQLMPAKSVYQGSV